MYRNFSFFQILGGAMAPLGLHVVSSLCRAPGHTWDTCSLHVSLKDSRNPRRHAVALQHSHLPGCSPLQLHFELLLSPFATIYNVRLIMYVPPLAPGRRHASTTRGPCSEQLATAPRKQPWMVCNLGCLWTSRNCQASPCRLMIPSTFYWSLIATDNNMFKKSCLWSLTFNMFTYMWMRTVPKMPVLSRKPEVDARTSQTGTFYVTMWK